MSVFVALVIQYGKRMRLVNTVTWLVRLYHVPFLHHLIKCTILGKNKFIEHKMWVLTLSVTFV